MKKSMFLCHKCPPGPAVPVTGLSPGPNSTKVRAFLVPTCGQMGFGMEHEVSASAYKRLSV